MHDAPVMLGRVAVVTSILGLFGGACQHAHASDLAEELSLAWKVVPLNAASAPSYLLATMHHIAPERLAAVNFTRSFSEGLPEVGAVATEVDPRAYLDLDRIRLSFRVRTPLEQRIPADTKTTVERALARIDRRFDEIRFIDTAMVATFLGHQASQSNGIDNHLRDYANERGLPVETLLSPHEHCSPVVDRLPADKVAYLAHMAMLLATRGPGRQQSEPEYEMLYLKGDLSAIARRVLADPHARAEIEGDAQANKLLAERVAARHGHYGSVAAGVGAFHLLGTQSVQRHLRELGFRVTPHPFHFHSVAP